MDRALPRQTLRIPAGGPRRNALFGLAAVLLAVAPLDALAGPYRLQPGDLIRIDIDGAPRAATVMMIDADGVLDHSRFGAIATAGLTIGELRERIADHLADTSLAFVTPEGERRSFLVERADVRVDIEAVRPVVVAGNVRSPGEIAWTPGLTARRAIALAGGVASMSGEPADLADLRAALDRLLIERAAAKLELWRLDAVAQVGRDAAAPVADPAVGQIALEAATRLAGIAAERLRVVMEGRRLARSQLNDRMALIEQQRELLRSLIVNYEASLADDERELKAVQALFDRGVAPRDRLTDVRRATVLSSTRLLEARSDESDIELESENVRQAMETLALREAEQDAVAREETMINLLDLEARLAAAQTAWNLAMVGAVPVVGTTLTVRIGGIGGSFAPASLDAELSPGDLVEVIADAER